MSKLSIHQEQTFETILKKQILLLKCTTISSRNYYSKIAIQSSNKRTSAYHESMSKPSKTSHPEPTQIEPKRFSTNGSSVMTNIIPDGIASLKSWCFKKKSRKRKKLERGKWLMIQRKKHGDFLSMQLKLIAGLLLLG